MRCPYCGKEESKVVDKRNTSRGIRRRRECLGCGKRYTTYERIEPAEFSVIKKDGRRERFSREKLKAGIEKACEKRPISIEKIEKLVDEIVEELRKKGKKEIKSKAIGELVMRKLKKLDKVAYIRFASVYREFADINEFKEELKRLANKKTRTTKKYKQYKQK